MRSIGFAAAVIAALCSFGCSHAHLTKDHGDSYVRAFAAQVDAKKPAEAVQGLDSQEAAITADNYRAALVPEGKTVQQEPMILIAPPSRERREPLAPSVPKE